MKRFLLTGLLVLAAQATQAASYHDLFHRDPDIKPELNTILNSIDFKRGKIDLPAAKASLNIPADFYFLDAKDGGAVLTKVWGNPPEAAEGVLGMLFPAQYSPEDGRSWGAVIEVDDSGYVSDTDALTTDYDALLTSMKTDTAADSEERKKRGEQAIELVGWASPPYYDKTSHVFHWAKELKFGEGADAAHTLNYSIRILGRESVLEMNFVAGMDQLAEIKTVIPTVFSLATFNAGRRYQDFADGDRVAAYGLAGLIAAGVGAKVAAKVGFLALVLGFGKKAILLVLLAGGAAWRSIKGLFGGRKTPGA
nr:DUF2167 domain-containing protein [uncultured Gellertiella sp.]